MQVRIKTKSDGHASTVTGRATTIANVGEITIPVARSDVPERRVLLQPTLRDLDGTIPACVVERIRVMVETRRESIISLYSVEIQPTQIVATFVAREANRLICLTKVFGFDRFRVAGLVIYPSANKICCKWIEADSYATSDEENGEFFFLKQLENNGFVLTTADIFQLGNDTGFDYMLSPLEGTPTNVFVVRLYNAQPPRLRETSREFHDWLNDASKAAFGLSLLQQHVANRLDSLRREDVANVSNMYFNITGLRTHSARVPSDP